MKGVGEVTIVSGAPLRGWRLPVARIEKASNSNPLGRQGGEPPPRGSRRPASAGASRFETESAPLWDGPPLRAAFVAQALGQVLPGGGDNRQQVRTAYAALRVGLGRVLDRTV
jgi:hypothetical protein